MKMNKISIRRFFSVWEKKIVSPDINLIKAKKWIFEEKIFQYSQKDILLYNISVGAGHDEQKKELQYIFEQNENFKVWQK